MLMYTIDNIHKYILNTDTYSYDLSDGLSVVNYNLIATHLIISLIIYYF